MDVIGAAREISLLVELAVPSAALLCEPVPVARVGFRRDLINEQFERRPRRAKHAERGWRATAEHLGPLVDLHDHRSVRPEIRIRIIGARHQQQISTHDRIVRWL